jgi:hypothetical protein
MILNIDVEKPGEKKESSNVKVKLFNNNDAMDVDGDDLTMQDKLVLFADKK